MSFLQFSRAADGKIGSLFGTMAHAPKPSSAEMFRSNMVQKLGGRTMSPWTGRAGTSMHGVSGSIPTGPRIGGPAAPIMGPPRPAASQMNLPLSASGTAKMGAKPIGYRKGSWGGAAAHFGRNMQKFMFSNSGISEQAMRTIGNPMMQGAVFGAAGSMAYGAGGFMFPGNFDREGSVFSSAARGAAYGAALGAVGAVGHGIGMSKFGGKFRPVRTAGRMMRSAHDSWAVRGALMAGSAISAGNFSITKPVNRGY